MGNSSSKSNQVITNNTVNQDYINSLNKTIMDSAVNTMVSNASSCSSAVNLNNSCNMSGTSVGGDFNFNGNQSSQAKVNFNCIQANQTSSDMATSMMSSMITEMKLLNGTESAAQLNTAAQASNKTGFGSTPGSSSSNASTNVSNTVTNETITNVENIFQQKLSNNFNSETVNECIGKTYISNSQDLSNMNIGGNANVECVQTASVEQVQNCKQLSSAVAKTTQATFQELGLKTDVTNKTTDSTISSNTSKSENISTGPIEELGNAFANILSAFGLAFLSPFLMPLSSICCCIIIMLCMAMVAKTLFNDSGSSMSQNYDVPNFSATNLSKNFSATNLSKK